MKKYVFNIAWLGSERIVSIVGGLAITVYVARYLGPEKMGIFNFSLAIISLVVPLCQLGADALVFNRIARNLTSGVKFLKSTLKLRLILYTLFSSLVFIYCYIQEYTYEQLGILALMMVSCLFSSQDIYRVYFDAILKSKFNSITTQIGLYCSLLLRFFLVKIQAGVIWFALPFIAYTFIPFIFRKYRFFRETHAIELQKENSQRYNKYLLSAGLPLAISSLSIVIYTRIGQVILGEALSVKSVAIYNAATTLGQGWNFLPMAVITTLMTKVIKDKTKITLGISFLYLTCILIALPIIALYYCFYNEIIHYTYGNDYIKAAQMLPIVSVSALFSVLGTASYRGIVALGGYRYLMWKMFCMAIMNIFLSVFLIRSFGLHGAVYSLLLTEIISCTIGNFFFKKGVIFKAQMGIVTSYKYLSNLH